MTCNRLNGPDQGHQGVVNGGGCEDIQLTRESKVLEIEQVKVEDQNAYPPRYVTLPRKLKTV